jgi:CHAT domain-containing protein/tetratricopeptide (TPR) repeat protein
MKRVLVGLVLGITLGTGGCAGAAEAPPPNKLTPEERKELEAKWQERVLAGVKYYRAGQLPEATEAAEKALATARRLYPKQDHPLLVVSLSNLAAVLYHRGKSADAKPLFQEALAMNRRLSPKQDKPELARNLNDLALVLRSQGKSADAEPLCREALAMNRRLYAKQDKPELTRSLNDLASVLKDQGKYADAEPLYREALALQRRLHPRQDHPYLAASVNNLASVLQDRGQYADAEPLYREALAMYRRLYPKQDHPYLAASLNNLAGVLQDRGQYAESEARFREAVAMDRRLHPKQDHPDLASSLNNLASTLQEQRKLAEAELLSREALAMRRRLYPRQDHPQVFVSLNNLATVLRDQGKFADAETLFHEALERNRRLYPRQDHPQLAGSLHNLAFILQDQRKYADAESLYREALAMYRALAEAYAAVRSEGEALTLASSYPRTRDGFLANARALQANPAEVYAEVWSSKAALSRVYERRALAARAAAADPRAAALLDQLTDRRRRRADLLLAPVPSDKATREQRDDDLNGYAKEIESLDRALRPLLPTIERANKLAKAIPANLQKILPPDAAVVDFLRYTLFEHDPKKPGKDGKKDTRHYLAFVVTRDKVAWLDLGKAQPLEDAVMAWREAITSGKPIPPELPAKVRDLAWDKVRKELSDKVKVVYVAPDLVLCRIPWAALPGNKPNTVLLEDYAVAVVPHAVFLLDKLGPQERLPNRPSGVLAVGGVAYDAEPPPPGGTGETRALTLVLKPGQKLQWPALPGAAAEAKGVTGAATKKKLVTRTLDGDRATASAVLAALPKVRSAHLATHGFFADASFRSAFRVDSALFQWTRHGERIGAGALSPMVMTGLVFAGANQPGTPGRGIATGEALVDLNLSGLELAVLSACETGLGDVADGEGTFGLQRAFHLARTRDVVTSLWKVPDRPTAALMALFYQNLWVKNLSPIEALRQAQLEIYRYPDTIPALAAGFRGKFVEVPGGAEEVMKPGPDGRAHPRLWAAFTLSGPGR